MVVALVGVVAAVEVLHDDEGPLLVLADVEDRDDVRLAREPRRREGLAHEALAEGIVLREPLGEHLHDHVAA